MLEDNGVDFEYREYRKEPLSLSELRKLMKQLGLKPKDVLRLKDKANRELGLTGEEPAAELLQAMSENPTLLQRPIGVVKDRAVVGRPVEALLELA